MSLPRLGNLLRLSVPLCHSASFISTLQITSQHSLLISVVSLAAKAQGWFSGVYAWYKQLAQVVEFVS